VGTARQTTGLLAVGLLAVAGLLLAAAPIAAGAAGVDALYIDGALDDPLSAGEQTLYEAPATTIAQDGASLDHSSVAITSSPGGWHFSFGSLFGEALTLGKHYGGTTVTRTGVTCTGNNGEFTVNEIAWDDAGHVTAFAADFAYSCNPLAPLWGSIRLGSAVPLVALATDALSLDLGQTEAGLPGTPATITVANIGDAPATLGATTPVGVSEYDVVSDGCAGTLAPGASCAVNVRLTGATIGLNRWWLVNIPDNSAQGQRSVKVVGDIWTDTTTTITFDPARSSWPSGTFLGATVSPAPAFGGTVTFTASDGPGAPLTYTAPLLNGQTGVLPAVPRGDHTWTATFSGDNAWRPSASTPMLHRTLLGTVTHLTATVNPVSVGDTVHLVATTASAAGEALPDGTVTITDSNGTTVGSGPVSAADGTVSADVTGLALGSHDFTATYVTSADGVSTYGTYREFVRTQGIAAGWTGTVPITGGILQTTGVATGSGGVFLVGLTSGTVTGATPAGGWDLVIARLDPATGVVVWAHQFGTTGTEGSGSITVTTDALYVTGSSTGALDPGGTTGTSRPFVARFTLGGDLVWVREGLRTGSPWVIANAPNGGVYVGSTTTSSAYPDRRSGQVRRYAPDGTLLWEREVTSCCAVGENGNVELRTLASDPGGLVVGGWAFGSVLGGDDATDRGWIRRLTPDGATVWTRQLEAADRVGSVDRLAVNQAGILVLGEGNLLDGWTRRYGLDGTTIWTHAVARVGAVPDCSGFATLAWTQAMPSGALVPVLSRMLTDGTDAWTFQQPGTDAQGYGFLDVALGPGVAYLAEEVDTASATTTQILQVTGIPAPTGCDTTAPIATAPRAGFLTGSVLGARTVPIHVTWTGTDRGSGLARYELRLRAGTAAWTLADDGLPTGRATTQVAPGRAYTFRGTVVDRAGNPATSTGPSLDLRQIDDRAASVAWSSGWRSLSSSSAAGGTVRASSKAGATATVRFTGRAFAWVAPTGPTRGSARVYVDGVYKATVSLWRSAPTSRVIVWASAWAASGTHTVTIRIIGTSGHPRVDIDAFLTLR